MMFTSVPKKAKHINSNDVRRFLLCSLPLFLCLCAHPMCFECVKRLIICAKRIFRIYPLKLCGVGSEMQQHTLTHFDIDIGKNMSQQFIDSLTNCFGYCVSISIFHRVKLDYHTSKRLQPQQHIDRDKNSSPISAGNFLCSQLLLVLLFCVAFDF